MSKDTAEDKEISTIVKILDILDDLDKAGVPNGDGKLRTRVQLLIASSERVLREHEEMVAFLDNVSMDRFYRVVDLMRRANEILRKIRKGE